MYVHLQRILDQVFYNRYSDADRFDKIADFKPVFSPFI